MEKGFAAPSLLDTYTEERIPVVAEVLRLSSELFINFLRSQATPASQAEVWRRGDELRQLDVHCRWSSIVVDERSPKETSPVDPYGRRHLSTDIVRAGERAPDAPGLVVLSAGEGAGETQRTTTSLFDIFGIAHHTVLIFSDGTDKDGRVMAVLKAYPAELLRVVVIHAETAGAAFTSPVAHMRLLDRDGHAHEEYQVPKGRFTVVIVRPDGIIGGIVFGEGGVKHYFGGIFNALRLQIRGML